MSQPCWHGGSGQTVALTTSTPGATIRYTINGVDPTASDPGLASGGTLVVGNYTLKAAAFKSGLLTSAVWTAAYAVTGQVTSSAVDGGGSHSLALRSDGTVWAWGYNGYGQLGDGTTTQRLFPVTVLLR